MSIISFFPSGKVPRPEQSQILHELQAGWDDYSVFVAQCPTAVGKTEIAVTLARWLEARGESANIAVPDNVILEQFLDRYPDLPTLQRQDTYRCETWQRSCAETKAKCKGFCKGCPYLAAKRGATKAKVRLLNYYTYWAHRLYAPVLIADEAHRLIDMLQDKKDIRIWRSDFKFPDGLVTVADVIDWGQKYLQRQDSPKLRAAIRDIVRIRDGATVEYKHDFKRGKDDVMLLVLPASTRAVPPWLWPYDKVRKIVLLSATIGPKDVAELGLSARRVMYLRCGSPIPAENRPFVFEPRCNMAMKYRDKALPHFVAAVREKLALHKGEKGLIHLPYSVMDRFRELCDDPRLMFADRENKLDVLEMFKNSRPEDGRVLVAAGVTEGLDLPYDAARWQVLGTVPWLNLGDERVRAKADKDPEWFDWEACKRILQAAGRIVRASDDQGISYLFDVNFERLYRADLRRKQPLFPKFFRDAVRMHPHK